MTDKELNKLYESISKQVKLFDKHKVNKGGLIRYIETLPKTEDGSRECTYIACALTDGVSKGLADRLYYEYLIHNVDIDFSDCISSSLAEAYGMIIESKIHYLLNEKSHLTEDGRDDIVRRYINKIRLKCPEQLWENVCIGAWASIEISCRFRKREPLKIEKEIFKYE